MCFRFFFFFQAEDGIRDVAVTGVQTCALPISQLFRRSRRFEGTFPGRPRNGIRIPWTLGKERTRGYHMVSSLRQGLRRKANQKLLWQRRSKYKEQPGTKRLTQE